MKVDENKMLATCHRLYLMTPEERKIQILQVVVVGRCWFYTLYRCQQIIKDLTKLNNSCKVSCSGHEQDDEANGHQP